MHHICLFSAGHIDFFAKIKSTLGGHSEIGSGSQSDVCRFLGKRDKHERKDFGHDFGHV